MFYFVSIGQEEVDNLHNKMRDLEVIHVTPFS